MKKVIMCILCLCIICGLMGCSDREDIGNGDFSVTILNSVSEDIYSIGYTYYVNEEVISSGGVCNADNSAIKKDDSFSLDNTPDADEFELELSVQDKEGKEYLCLTKLMIDRKFAEQYVFYISGDFENGFEVLSVASNKSGIFEITMTIPAGSTEEFVYSDVEISPTKDTIIFYVGQNVGDSAVCLKPIEVKEENHYEPSYVTPGMGTEMNVEKGAWYKVGLAMVNPTDEDIRVTIKIENIEVRK